MNKGFSLIEVLLAVTLLGAIGGIGLPIYQNYFIKQSLDYAVSSLAYSARRAQLYATAGKMDSPWGVKINPGSITIFRGDSYATRIVGDDIITEISPSISSSGTTEYVFTKIFGVTSISGTTTLANVSGGLKSISVNSRGMVSY